MVVGSNSGRLSSLKRPPDRSLGSHLTLQAISLFTPDFLSLPVIETGLLGFLFLESLPRDTSGINLHSNRPP